jgi:hypothetical protein
MEDILSIVGRAWTASPVAECAQCCVCSKVGEGLINLELAACYCPVVPLVCCRGMGGPLLSWDWYSVRGACQQQ